MKKKKLTLNKITITNLSGKELQKIIGGYSNYCGGSGNFSCECDTPDTPNTQGSCANILHP